MNPLTWFADLPPWALLVGLTLILLYKLAQTWSVRTADKEMVVRDWLTGTFVRRGATQSDSAQPPPAVLADNEPGIRSPSQTAKRRHSA